MVFRTLEMFFKGLGLKKGALVHRSPYLFYDIPLQMVACKSC